ncbi:MAG: hypothetical protein LBQ79_01480, partial [Deltaproteobacteria bacterium]|nr:hypothetical protein [Deltaproteobacteria bacterium]
MNGKFHDAAYLSVISCHSLVILSVLFLWCGPAAGLLIPDVVAVGKRWAGAESPVEVSRLFGGAPFGGSPDPAGGSPAPLAGERQARRDGWRQARLDGDMPSRERTADETVRDETARDVTVSAVKLKSRGLPNFPKELRKADPGREFLPAGGKTAVPEPSEPSELSGFAERIPSSGGRPSANASTCGDSHRFGNDLPAAESFPTGAGTAWGDTPPAKGIRELAGGPMGFSGVPVIPSLSDRSGISDLSDISKISEIPTLYDISSLSHLSVIPAYPVITDISDLSDNPELQHLSVIQALPDFSDISELSTLSDFSTLSYLSAIPPLSDISDFSALADITDIPDISGIQKLTDIHGLPSPSGPRDRTGISGGSGLMAGPEIEDSPGFRGISKFLPGSRADMPSSLYATHGMNGQTGPVSSLPQVSRLLPVAP